MKQLFVFLSLFFIVMTAKAQTDTSAKVDINIQNGSLFDIIQQIEKQSEFQFYYDVRQLSKDPINYSQNKISIGSILNIYSLV
jgi:hypothetical protein